MARPPINGHRVHVILTDPQTRSLTQIAKRTGLTTSELLRRAVDLFIQRQTKKAET